MNASDDVKTDLTEYLRELHLPAIRQCFEEKARQAERETLSYEQISVGSRRTRMLGTAREPNHAPTERRQTSARKDAG